MSGLGTALDRQRASERLRRSLIGYVKDEATALRALDRYLAVEGSKEGGTRLSDFRCEVELLGKSTWLIYATCKHLSPASTTLFIADSDGVRPASLVNLTYAHRKECSRSFDKEAHQKIIESMIRLHSGQPHRQPAKIISTIREIPGYEKKPLDPDLEAVIRPSFSSENERGDVTYIVYTYSQGGGGVYRYKFGFRREGVGLYRAERVELGRGIGDARRRAGIRGGHHVGDLTAMG